MNEELYWFIKIYQEVANLFFLEFEVFGQTFRVIDYILFGAIGHFILDILETIYTRGRDNG